MTVGNLVGQLIAFPLGRGLAKALPDITICGMQLSPGPFTVKEHVLVTIMGTVGYQATFATDIIAVQRVFYNQSWNFSCKSTSAPFCPYNAPRVLTLVYRSVADGNVHTAHWLLDGWYRSPLPGHSFIYDLAL